MADGTPTLRRIIDRDFLTTLLLNYDSSLDVSEGSSLDIYVISPILSRVQDDPLRVDFSELAESILRTRFPDLEGTEASALYDVVVKPMSVMIESIYTALRTLANSLSLVDWEQMSSTEIDALLANFFYSRPAQQYATGQVRIYYTQPVDIEVGEGVVFYTKDGLQFVPAAPQRATSAQMALNKVGDLYYVDVAVVAAEVGDEYNVGVGEITRMTGLAQAVKVSNTTSMSGGTAKVDNFDAIAEARALISQRSLVTYNGIVATISDLVAGLRAIQVVGYGDPEMIRDVITGGSAGAPVAAAADLLFENDGLGDGKTALVISYTADFVDLLGLGGVSGYVLSASGQDFDVVEVIDSSTVRIGSRVAVDGTRSPVLTGTDLQTFAGKSFVYSSSINFTTSPIVVGQAVYLDDPTVGGWYRIESVGYGDDAASIHRLLLDRPASAAVSGVSFSVAFGHSWTLRRKVLEYKIPEGEQKTEPVASDGSVHIGGAADVYVAADLQEMQTQLESVSDMIPVSVGYQLQTYADPAVHLDQVQEIGTDFNYEGVKPGHVLHVYTGTAAGVYTVVKVDDDHHDVLHIYPEVGAAFSGAAYEITDEVDVELTDAQDILYRGSDLITHGGSVTVRSADGVDFLSLGAVAGESVLEIRSGYDRGTYEIKSIGGATNHILTLDRAPTRSESGVSYTVSRWLDSLTAPIVEVTKVEYDDGSGTVTGELPYGKPVSAWVQSAFTNSLHGTIPINPQGWLYEDDLYVVTGIVTEDLSEIDASTTDGKTLQFDLDGEVTTITLGSNTTWDQAVADLDQYPLLRGRVALQSWHDGVYLTISYSGPKVLKLIGGTFESVVSFLNKTSAGEVRSDLATLRRPTYYSTIGEPIQLHDLDVWRTRIRVIGPNSTAWLWVFEISDGLLSSGSTLEKCVAVTYMPGGTTAHAPAGIYDAQVGYASSGTVRVRYKNPTVSRFLGPLPPTTLSGFGWPDREPTVLVDPLGRTFYPDPMFSSRVVPGEMSDDLLNNGVTLTTTFKCDGTGSVLPDRDESVDFRKWGVRVGDLVTLYTRPLIGTVDLSASFPDVDGKYLKIAVGDHPQLTEVIFDSSVTDLSSCADYINSKIGQDIAVVASTYLALESDDVIVLISDGSGSDATSDLFGFVAGSYSSKASGQSPISSISDDGSTANLVQVIGSETNYHADIARPSSQMATALDMVDDGFGFYFFDIEVVSEGFGDDWNLEAGTELTVEGDETLGWKCWSARPELTFSSEEELWMTVSTHVVDEGAKNDPANWVSIVGSNLTINATTSAVVERVQGILDNPSYQVVTADLLAKHLRPIRVYLDLSYTGGIEAKKLEQQVKNLVESTSPGEALTVQQLSQLLHRLGAGSVVHPLEIVWLEVDDDRRLVLKHSQDRLSSGQRSILYLGQAVVERG